MGNTVYNVSYTANFRPLIGLITVMMSDKMMLAKYPISENANKILKSKQVLKNLMDPSNNSQGIMLEMCKNDFKLSKKIAKQHVKSFDANSVEELADSLVGMRSFLLIKDNLQLTRMNWIIGVSHLLNAKEMGKPIFEYGLDFVKKEN